MFAKRDDQSPGAAAGAPPPAAPGSIVGGAYRVERLLGQDALGHVVAATHLHLKERVTLRFLRPAAPALAARAAALADEARRASGLANEHLPRVLEVGALGDGTAFVATEYLEGRDLGARLREGVALHPSEAVEYVIQACAGLADAHGAGAGHGEVRPENLFLMRRPDGSPLVKVLGSGLARLAPRGARVPPVDEGESAASIYSPPERLGPGGDVDPRGDVWSLGAVLFELLTARPAFAAATLSELRALVFEQPAPRASAFRPEVPAGLDEAVARCLERDPAARFQNGAELALALLAFAPRRAGAVVERAALALGLSAPRPADDASAPPAGRPSLPGALPSPAPLPSTAASTATASSDELKAQRRTLRIGTAVALFMVAAGMVGLLLERRGAPPPAAPVAAAPDRAASAPSAPAPPDDPAPEAAADDPAPAEPLRAATKAGAHRPRLARPASSPGAPAASPAARSTVELDIRSKR